MSEEAVLPSGSSIGATVEGLSLADLTEESAARLRDLLDQYGVLALPGQHLDDESLARVASVWAAPEPHPVVAFLGGTDVIGVVFNDADHPPADIGDSSFHTDYSFNNEIPDVAVLQSVIAPPIGGATRWADAVAALERLEPDVRARLDRLTARHDPGPRFVYEMEVRMGAELAERVGERFGAGVDHPVVARHPRTGAPLLFVNAGYTRHLNGVSAEESAALLDRLLAIFDDPGIQFEHHWTAGDVVIWDEHRTVHRGPSDFGTHTRELHRCTAGRTAPAPPLLC